MTEDFYSESTLDINIIDRWSYRGRGRPRKIDYIPMKVAIKKYNKYWNEYLNLRAKQIYPALKVKEELL